ncbi:ABC transporter permease [Frankia sp. CNm7]|uniref:ABC transporter permease n=1 Tax=Frankia nepalensis TaxID=1836974 RepID=A0A937UUK6_9ACTN|nr:ABC transporter permease [Frankia nepalensis]MBL7499833.1 ABC transporter permease [Frankia nepalensis]MBL7513650.1 ABC transporter permease [Frankia nepalensis]MBL7519537.1 ABC transporter permease [Frankia nepalensis]MBL7631261.1 ABC transporter permease [Frankia nepalensis]
MTADVHLVPEPEAATLTKTAPAKNTPAKNVLAKNASPAAVAARAEAGGGRYDGLRAGLAQLVRKPVFLLALLYVLFVVVSAFAPGLFTNQDPIETHPQLAVLAPSLDHPFGTDYYGRDLWSRVLHGSALTIQATLIALGIATVAGLALGVVAGFFGGVVDALLMRIVDVQLAIPGLLMALSIVTALGYGTVPVAIAVGVSIVPGFARTTRAEVLRVKTLPYVEAARAAGAGWGRVLARHVLPNSWGPVAVLAVLDTGVAIIAIASLSFLGFGAKPPAAEWGTLISDGRDYLITASWLSLLPGLFVALLVLSLNHISKTLQELER